MHRQSIVSAVNVVLLLVYTVWDIATFWNSPAHGSPPPGVGTAFLCIVHSIVLAVIYLVFSLLRKEQFADVLQRQMVMVALAGITTGVLLAGAWILNGLIRTR